LKSENRKRPFPPFGKGRSRELNLIGLTRCYFVVGAGGGGVGGVLVPLAGGKGVEPEMVVDTGIGGVGGRPLQVGSVLNGQQPVASISYPRAR
jgi:hypothetical protein